jgi:hypothetical protein
VLDISPRLSPACAEWQPIDLAVPKLVTDATEGYRVGYLRLIWAGPENVAIGSIGRSAPIFPGTLSAGPSTREASSENPHPPIHRRARRPRSYAETAHRTGLVLQGRHAASILVCRVGKPTDNERSAVVPNQLLLRATTAMAIRPMAPTVRDPSPAPLGPATARLV